MKKGKLFLFEWNKEAAQARAKQLPAKWIVETEFEEGSRGCRNCKAFEPDVIVLDLAVKPSHSREVGRALRQFKPMRTLPLVFLDGAEEDVAKAKAKVADGIFVTSGQLSKVLSKLPAKNAAA
jgi:CheY-like chemotaxis protein